jgi:hypothetical protein
MTCSESSHYAEGSLKFYCFRAGGAVVPILYVEVTASFARQPRRFPPATFLPTELSRLFGESLRDEKDPSLDGTYVAYLTYRFRERLPGGFPVNHHI